MSNAQAVNAKPAMLPDTIWQLAISEGFGVIVTDYLVARKEAVHYAFDPFTGQYWITRRIIEVAQHLQDAGHTGALLTTADDDGNPVIYGTMYIDEGAITNG